MSTDSDDEVFVPYPALAQHGIGFTRVHLRRLMAKDEFPPAYQLSANRVAWKLSELNAWKANRPRRVPVAA